jgi:hypothetical protein
MSDSATNMTPEQMVEYVKEHMKEACSHFLSEPLKAEKVLVFIKETLEKFSPAEFDKQMARERDAAVNILAEICMLEWAVSGMPEDYNPHDRVRALADWTIDFWHERLQGAGTAGQLIMLEHLFRHDNLGSDWEFHRVDKHHADLSFQVKHPIKYIQCTFAVDALPETDGDKDAEGRPAGDQLPGAGRLPEADR